MTEYNAGQIIAMLRERFKVSAETYNEAVLLEQVPDGTGYSQSRWIDAVVFQMWPSKGLRRLAFEVKVTRQDFTRELNNPIKHAWCKECFHEFWFVAPKDVIQLEELPDKVGWMYPAGKRLNIARHAVLNDKPKLDDKLLAGFMRAAYKGIAEATRQQKQAILDSDIGYQHAKMYEEATLRFLTTRHQSLRPIIESADDVFKELEASVLDDQVKYDREQLTQIAGNFQNKIVDLLGTMLVISRKAILARNELGRHIVSSFGGNDQFALEELKALAGKKGAWEGQKRYAEMIETLIGWDQVRPKD